MRALLIVAVIGGAAPYAADVLGLSFDTRPGVEVVDHVVPGALVVAVASLMLVAGKAQLLGALFAVLAGLWMTATHVPLLAQSDQVGLDAALWMFVPSVALFAAAIGVAVIAWTEENARA